MNSSIEQLQEECDGFLPGVCGAMIAERLREGGRGASGERVKRRLRITVPLPTPTTRKLVLEAYRSRCVYCGSDKEIDLDFLVPACRDGNARPENLVPACLRCRVDRGTKHLEIWFKLRLDLDDHAIYARIGQATWRLRHSGETLQRAA